MKTIGQCSRVSIHCILRQQSLVSSGKFRSVYCKSNSVFFLIDHFTVVCSVTWPLNGSEAAADLVLIKTLLLLLCKSSCSHTN